jgi:hypothetical protein
VIGHVFKHARATNGRRLRIALAARGGKVRSARVTLRSHAGKLVGRSKRLAVVKRRRAVVIRLRHPLTRGRYLVVARGRGSGGRIVAAKRRFRLR